MKRSTLFFLLGFVMIFAGIATLMITAISSSSSYGVAFAVFPFPFIFVAGKPEGMVYIVAIASMVFFVIVLVIYALMLYFIANKIKKQNS